MSYKGRDVISEFLNISPLKESALLKIEEDVTWVLENTCSYAAGEYNPFFGKSHTLESKNLISKSQIGNKKRLGKYHGEDTRKKISESTKSRFKDQNERDKISNTLKGKKLLEETKKKMSLSRKGLVKSEEHKRKISEANKNVEKVECIHCGKRMQRGVHNRWHGKNCKVINV